LNELKEIGQRIAHFFKKHNIGVNQAGRDTGTSGAQISNIINGKTYGVDKLLNIFNAYPSLNKEWVLTGVGEMENVPSNVLPDVLKSSDTKIKSTQKPYPESPFKKILVASEGFGYKTYPTQRVPNVITVSPTGKDLVPFVPIKAQAGYLVGYEDPQYIAELPTYNIPGLNHGIYRGFQVAGHSMYQPTRAGLSDGHWVVGQYVDDLQDIKDYRVYVIVTATEGVIIKRCINRLLGEEHKLICISDNKSGDYPDIIVPIHDIKEVWQFKMHLRPEVPSPEDIFTQFTNMRGDISLLKDELKELKDKLSRLEGGE
jgi:hypothetical protein